jgi:hypothetical protein
VYVLFILGWAYRYIQLREEHRWKKTGKVEHWQEGKENGEVEHASAVQHQRKDQGIIGITEVGGRLNVRYAKLQFRLPYNT